ncbi:MAG: oxygen-insensitive NAD(P)H nitroreductase [Massilibacteroides sp.]|nr:oxygen-insensitive NAD(P)H nitroreductase [Massilibacteroides sp.]
MNITEALNYRYAVKSFDSTQKISAEDFEQITNILQLSPSSTNLQPWHFIIAKNEEGLKRIAKGANGFYKFNEPKIMDASHAIVFCTKAYADETHLQKILEKEEKDKRFPEAQFKFQMDGARRLFLNIHRYDWKDEAQWHTHQVYLNMGAVLLGAATLGIDVCPMEGLDFSILNEEFGLTEKGFSAVSVLALGYRDKEDFNTPEKLPKSRLAKKDIFTLA